MRYCNYLMKLYLQTEEVSAAVSAGASSGDPSTKASTGRKGQRKKLCLQPYRLLASFCPCLPSNPSCVPMPVLGTKLNMNRSSSRDQSKEKEGSRGPGDSGYNSLLIRPDSELSDLTPHYCSPFCIYWKQCSDFTVEAVNP